MVTIAAHDPPIYKLERHRRAPGQFQSSPERVQDATGFYIYRQMSARVQTTYRIGGAESTTQNSMGQTCDPQGLPNGNPMQRTDESKRTPTSCKSEVSRRTAQRNSSSLSPLKLCGQLGSDDRGRKMTACLYRSSDGSDNRRQIDNRTPMILAGR